jgi:intein/homing endonuclease
MRDNDPIIGAVMFAIEQVLEKATWSIRPAGKSALDKEAANFLKSCMNDMSHSWQEFISEVSTMLTYGWSFHEVTFKLRKGYTNDPRTSSQESDGLIGWRSISRRMQSSFADWVFDENTGELTAFQQVAPPDYARRTIPLSKGLLFRTKLDGENPEGRALHPNTPIPTPDGWRKLDDLKPGDKVFGSDGKVRYVTARKDWEDRPCYALMFKGGYGILADEKHQWVTQTLYERSNEDCPRENSVRITAEIFNTQHTGVGSSNHSINLAGALDFPEQLLPLNPYFLGLWLGDGNSASSRVTCHADDAEETADTLRRLCGYNVQIKHNGKTGGLGRILEIQGDEKWSKLGPQSLLRSLGLINNKHIPEVYLRGSVEQRKLLLAGLMDSDGYVDRNGRCEFCNTNEKLARGVSFLVRSLGNEAYAMIKKANGVDRKLDAHLIKFTPIESPFLLKRKTDRVVCSHTRRRHYIQQVEYIGKFRTVCIEVDSPDHLFLAGEGMVPTHNSILRNAYRPYYFKKNIEEIEAIGIERDLVGLPVIQPPEGFDIDSEEHTAVRLAIEQMIANLRRDEQDGIFLPFGFTIELLQIGSSRRQFDTDKIINRYDKRIAATVLAQFIMLGMDRVGSFALSSNQSDLFLVAVQSILGRICAHLNRVAIPQLFSLNGKFQGLGSKLPRLVVSKVTDPNLDELSNYVSRLAGKGFILPKSRILTELEDIAGLGNSASDSVGDINVEGQGEELVEAPQLPGTRKDPEEIKLQREALEEKRKAAEKASKAAPKKAMGVETVVETGTGTGTETGTGGD